MKRLIINLCLTINLVLESFGVGWSSDYKKGMDAYIKGDYATALNEWWPLAEEGDASAQYNLGYMFDKGKGIPQDYKTAVKWYTFSAEQGNARAQYSLGERYAFGDGVIKDMVYAHMWANISASNGEKQSEVWYASVELKYYLTKKMTPSQIEEAQRLARECVKKNYKGC